MFPWTRERISKYIPRKKSVNVKIWKNIYIFPGGAFLITRLTRDFDRAKKKGYFFSNVETRPIKQPVITLSFQSRIPFHRFFFSPSFFLLTEMEFVEFPRSDAWLLTRGVNNERGADRWEKGRRGRDEKCRGEDGQVHAPQHTDVRSDLGWSESGRESNRDPRRVEIRH